MDPKFQIFSGVLKAFEDNDGRKLISTTASSSVEDLHGDDFTPSAINRMAESARASGMTIFLNHQYRVPEDVFGWTVDATAVQRGADKAGKAVWDLDLTAAVEESNERALATYNMIRGANGKKGVKLGVSIGAIVRDYERKDNGAMSISDVELLEASIVGIPANPRSWVRAAVKSLNEFVGVTKEEDCADCGDEPSVSKATWDTAYVNSLPDSAFACIDKNGRHYPHHDKGGAVDAPHLRAALSRVGDPANAQCGGKAKAHLEAHAKALGIGQKDINDLRALWGLPPIDGGNAQSLGTAAGAMVVSVGLESGDLDNLMSAAMTAVLDGEQPDLDTALAEFLPLFTEAAADNEQMHSHDHAHEHGHLHAHADDTIHEHDHAHVHAHSHEHGGEADHPHSETMASPEHDHEHEDYTTEHAHSALTPSDDAEPSEGDETEMANAATPEQTTSPVELGDGAQENAVVRSGGDALEMVASPLLAALTAEVKTLKQQVATKDSELRAAREERDEMERTLRAAVEIVERIARTPLGPKTSFAAPIRDFREKFGDLYGEEFVNLLETKK